MTDNPIPQPNQAPADQKAMRILLVEDNLVNQRLTIMQLQRLGYKADLAKDGEEAVELARQHPYDLILMDCHLPGELDGFGATRQIRATPGGQEATIVAFTASILRDGKEKCISEGMDDYLGKPAKMEDLTRVLTKRKTKPEV
jgi:CheY-like chemotaxis protein